MTADRRRKLAPPFLMGRPMKVIPLLFAALLATFSPPAFAQTPLKLGLLLGPTRTSAAKALSRPRVWRPTTSVAMCWGAR
jgi:hypothetical protein